MTGTDIVFGKIEPKECLTLTSRMADGGVLFSDGVIGDAIEFNSGVAVEIRLAQQVGNLIV